MGINASKLAQKVSESAKSEEPAHTVSENSILQEQGSIDSIPSTPIVTPKIVRENIEKETYLDPRSPSKHIARTPIEFLPAVSAKLQSLTLERDDCKIYTPLKNHILLGIDPRSPTLEIQRTPIVVSASPDKKLPAKIRNKNLDKVLKCAVPNTPKRKIVPPKLLESCPVTPKPKSDAYKRKSFVLLETNVDFTETDLDHVMKEKYLGKSLQNLYDTGDTSYNEIDDPRSPTVNFLRTPIQVCTKSDDSNDPEIEDLSVQKEEKDVGVNVLNENQSQDILVNMEKVSPEIIQPEQTLLPVNNETCIEDNSSRVNVIDQNFTELDDQDHNQPEEETEQHQIPSPLLVSELVVDTCEITNEESITVTPCKKVCPTTTLEQKIVVAPIPKQEVQFTRSAPVSPPSVVNVTPKKSKSQPVTPPIIDLTADVKELDKKLTHLIYEDEDLVVCPRIVKIKDQHRTPLGLRNGTDNKKSTQKLKVSDKPRKAEYTVSKIPVFKEKKIKVQCENTPPKGMRGNMHKKSQWDAKDDTLVI